LPARAASEHHAFVAPEVTSQLAHGDRARVLVELRLAGDAPQRNEAIVRAQDAVLAHLPSTHAQVVRRYTSVPLLALEIDATALNALRTLPEVLAVKADQAMRTQ
jgi:hypothetical protein